LFCVQVGVAQLGSKERRCTDCLGKFKIIVEILGLRFGYCLVIFAITNRSTKVRDAKVGNLDAMIFTPQEVGWLDIAVDDTLIMQVFKT